MMAVLMEGLILLLIASVTMSQYISPFQYDILSHGSGINGSSPVGNCTGATLERQSDFIQFTCSQPTSSVLFDGIIPTLTELNGSMWASQLLTLMTQSSAEITFQFDNDYAGVDRVEITMFNCPQWGIGVEIIVLNSRMTTINITSCDSLVTVCIPCSNCDGTQRIVSMAIHPFIGAQWVHIAEITFVHESNLTDCSQETFIPTTTSPPDTDAITTTPLPITHTPSPSITMTPLPTPDTTIHSTPSVFCPTTVSNPCPSCSTSTVLASVISIISTALLTTVISVLVHIALCKCHQRFGAPRPKGAASGNLAEEEQSVYAEVGGHIGSGVTVVNDHEYMEVGPGGGGGGGGGGDKNTVDLKLDQIYDNISGKSY